MHPPSPNTVFFDAANTLLALKESVGHGYASVARNFGLNLDHAQVDAAFKTQWKNMPPYNPGTPQPDDGKSWWRDLVDRTLDSLPLPPIPNPLRRQYFEALYAHYASPEQWTPCPEARPVLENLAANPRLRLGVISNFDRRLYRILEELGLRRFLHHIILSTEIGFSKPHRGIFTAACRRARAEPSRCLHVGDDPDEDWEGARRAGLQVFPLVPGKSTLRDLPGFLEALPK